MMDNVDFHYTRARRRQRLAAWMCMVVALLMLMGVLVYSFQTGILPGFAGTHGQLTLPGFGRVPGRSDCSTPDHPTGDSTLSLNSGGMQRSFIVHLPPSYGQEPQAVVLNYHGYDNTAARMDKYTDMGTEADRANFIVVFPQGADDSVGKTSWNAGIGVSGTTGNADDVQFTRDMLRYLHRNYCIDTHRIYVTGYSIGASMAYRVACTLSDQIAALATVEGAFYHFDGGCQPTSPMPVLEIHGQADQFAPYDGAPDRKLASVQTFLNVWFNLDTCNTNSSSTIFQQADVTGLKWSSCAKGTVVEHYRISDGGHVWPGSATPMPDLGYTTHTIDANTVIWNFFSAFKR